MQNSSAKNSHSYRKVDDIEREVIIGLTETFKNLALAIANYIRQSGTKYGELGFYYQGLAYASARKRIYDILKNAAKSVAVERVQDPLCFQARATDKFDYVASSDGIEIDDDERNQVVEELLLKYVRQGEQCQNETTQQSQSTINISTFDPSPVDATLPGNNDSTLSAVTSTAILTSNQPNSLNVNSLWSMFTSFVSNVADKASTQIPSSPASSAINIDSLIPSSSSIQPSKILGDRRCAPNRQTLDHLSLGLDDIEDYSPSHGPLAKRLCIRPQQNKTSNLNRQKHARPPASFSKPSTNKNVLTNSQVSFDDNDEEEEISLTVPTKRERPISTFDTSGMSDNDDDNILVKKRVPLVTQTTNTLTNLNKLIAKFDKCPD
ncbi:unnamed protein product [Didymodactylos carnosus]|uniref:Uncharacterized protein n=1 Tax=Didymodactylos carnosus TaxID=1234261 RepID=A0A815N990_9BILA|nr:unnamed protein product [Didymodactylos carnosus]CAF1433435.1 unnamed protein product [Didymodactylos carnosus]CAF3706571.1 unnamed protein product [Didymodactylos carnosus]CAF4311507.1 unnamed protein product [Didymodactylos carnosus]